MAIFKDYNVTVKQLLGFIPEALIANLSVTTKIDHYAKVLHGNKPFYLLFYCILDNDRLSQRNLEDTFNDSVFKVLFNLDECTSAGYLIERISDGKSREAVAYQF